jgi:hypothetical protein
MFGWTASYRLHFGYRNPVTPTDIVRCAQWASEIDAPNEFLGDTLGLLRSSHSFFTSVVATEISAPGGLQHLLLMSDAIQQGGDDVEPVMSAGQSVQVEWLIGKPGRGVNGRTFFPYFGGSSYEAGSVDKVNDATTEAVAFTCNQFAAYTPAAIQAELVVATRQRGGMPVNVVDSSPVTGTRVVTSVFRHQRRRVQPNKPFSPTP